MYSIGSMRSISRGLRHGLFSSATPPSSISSSSSIWKSNKIFLGRGQWNNNYSGNNNQQFNQQRTPFSTTPKTNATRSSSKAWMFGLAALVGGLAYLWWDDWKLPALFDSKKKDDSNLPVEQAPMSFAPNMPPPITRKYPVRLKVNMEATVKRLPIDAINFYDCWTFCDHVPGPMIRARVGDVIDVCLTNKDDSGMQHNLDFHAVTGPGGGAPVLTADSNESKNASFKLLRPGLFIYHCAVAPVGEHMGNGMYGLILVEPEDGLPKVDREFYVVQSEFYAEPEVSIIAAKQKEKTEPRMMEFSYNRAINEHPSHVVFNGRAGALIEEGQLKAKTGERIRIYFGNAGPNLISSFHVIGTIFDKVYREGDLISPPARYLQTTTVPAGGAAVIEIDFTVPGNFTLVDHAIWRIEKGCVGFINVEGQPRPDIYFSTGEPTNCPDCKVHPS